MVTKSQLLSSSREIWANRFPKYSWQIISWVRAVNPGGSSKLWKAKLPCCFIYVALNASSTISSSAVNCPDTLISWIKFPPWYKGIAWWIKALQTSSESCCLSSKLEVKLTVDSGNTNAFRHMTTSIIYQKHGAFLIFKNKNRRTIGKMWRVPNENCI